MKEYGYRLDLTKEGLITFEQSRHLMALELYPQPQHIKAWYVQYDCWGYWPIDEYETWSLEYKKSSDETSDYGYSNPIFYPVVTQEFYKEVIKGKEPIGKYDMNGIADYSMNKFNY